MIETNNLRLLACNEEILKAAIEGDAVLAHVLAANIPERWTEFGAAAFQYALDRIRIAPQESHWLTYFPIHKADNTLIGSCGYKGKPIDGVVEIGYEVAESYRSSGYATEIASALVQHAFEYSEVKTVLAHTLAEENPSTSVLKKCGFKKTGELLDDEDGLIWKWAIDAVS